MRDLASLGYKESFAPFGDPDAQDPDPDVRKRFFGKYRGSVVNNLDPLQQGRLIVLVPDVFGILPSSWALPCVPMAGPLMGTSFVPPPVGSSVWVEFEQGDPEAPIWVGCFWGTPETLGWMAKVAALEDGPSVTLETATSGIGVSDLPTLPPTAGNVSLYAAKGASSISLSPEDVIIKAPTVGIQAPTVAMEVATVVIQAETVAIEAETTVAIQAPTVEITAALTVNGDLTANGALTVSGDSTANGAVMANGALMANGDLTVDGVLMANGDLTVDGVATVDGITVP